MTGLRVGHGYDVHRLAQGRPLILGGVTIPWEKGLDRMLSPMTPGFWGRRSGFLRVQIHLIDQCRNQE